ncbi:MAG: hypothetical protein VKL59_16830 [Nostocaceae cyanobacterium]|nr:hypothetical protein [Nostocaceae cyanobacterium]
MIGKTDFLPQTNSTVCLSSAIALSRLNGLVAISLYTAEKPHFNRAIRNGGKQARWWLPLIWIAVIFGTLLLLQMLFI